MILQDRRRRVSLVALFGLLAGGCLPAAQIESVLRTAAEAVNSVVDNVQSQDPRTADIPAAVGAQGDSVDVASGVDVVVNVEEQIAPEDLPNITLVGFENLTGADIFVDYLADGVDQGVFVFDGDTLLLDYDCLGEVRLVEEDDFDPVTGEFLALFEFDLTMVNPDDFACGDLVLFSFEPDGITASAVPLASQ